MGYSVLNIDWPVESGPYSLYEGFGAKDFMSLDPLLGTDADWDAFVGEAHERGMMVVSDFNPSYFWTGAPAFKKACAVVRSFGLHSLPVDSTARWFRWTASCPGASEQPPDGHPTNGFTDGWVFSPAADACYWSTWGKGQPCGDLASPEWRKQLTRIFSHWADRGLDGFLLDAPPYYLGSVTFEESNSRARRSAASLLHATAPRCACSVDEPRIPPVDSRRALMTGCTTPSSRATSER